MPSIQELIDLNDRTEAARRDAAAAETSAKTAADAAARGQEAHAAAAQRAAETQSRLDTIREAIAQIPAAQAEVQAAEQEVAEITDQLAQLDVQIAALEEEIERRRTTFPFIVPPALLNALNQLRIERESRRQQQEQALARLAEAQARLEQLQAQADQLDAAQRAADEAAAEANRLEAELAPLVQAAQATQAQAATARATAQALEAQRQSTLDGLFSNLRRDVPIALLPVRIETRFHRPAPDQPPDELLIRLYLDDIHQDSHELGLTRDEDIAGKHFWRETWRAGLVAESDPAYSERHKQELAGWQQLAARFGPARTAYIAGKLLPTNAQARPPQLNTDRRVPLAVEPQFDANQQLRGASWTRAARARALPDRWLAIGYRNRQIANTMWGKLISESLATGPDPSRVASLQADPNVKVPVDPGMRWMVDFDEAEANGMGLRMKLTDDDASNGFERLIVLGVKGTLNNPQEGARELNDLIDAHRFSWGCALIPQGTPTNNTETVRSGYSREDVGFQTSFALQQDRALAASDDGAQAALALGLDAGVFAHLRYADGHDQRDAANVNRVLWPATIGYFLDQISNEILPGYAPDAWRDYFVRNVRARGPLPALRVGRQPYGLLPVTSLDQWASGRMELVNLLKSLRDIWRDAQRTVAYAGRDQTEIGRDLIEVLGQEPLSSSYSWRWARGPRFFDLFWQLPGQQVDPVQLDASRQTLEGRVQTALQGIGLAGGRWTRLTAMTFARMAFNWDGSLVEAGEVSETNTLAHNYIRLLADPRISLDEIHDESATLFPPDQPKPLLYRLLRHATLLAYAEQVLQSNPWPRHTPVDPPRFEPELVDMDQGFSDQPGDPFETPTFWRVLKTVPPGSTVSLGDGLRQQGLHAPDPLHAFLGSLNQLAGIPTAQLERLLAETLDLASHRLDAWITSLATQRLNQFRAAAASSTGIYLGGYGWVENLRPRQDPSLSDGFVHAPSLAQATAAAVLRSGHLAYKAQPKGARLEIDLSSQRVRTALVLIDGVRQGQPLGALLGYRLERSLHEASPPLNQVIARLRELAPLAGGKLVPKDSEAPLEAVAANNVVDGLKLLERSQNDKTLLDQFNAAEQATIKGALKEIADAVDAMGDLVLAEGVYQAVQGNYLRAGGTLDAISRGETPGEVQIVQTPQSGVAFTQRLVALFNASPSPAGAWRRDRARAIAEPILNAWAEELLGAPKRVRYKTQYFKSGKDPLKDEPDATADFDLAVLNLCALDIIYAPPITNEAQQTELELRLARAAMQKKPPTITSDASVRLVFARDASFQQNELTFPELFELARAVRELFTNSRALDARDLARAGAGGEPGIVASQLDLRLTDSLDLWQQAKQALRGLFDVDKPADLDRLKAEPFNIPEALVGAKVNLLDLPGNPGLPNPIDLADVSSALDVPAVAKLDDLRDALDAFSAFAVQGGVPVSFSGDTTEARRELVLQARRLYAQVKGIDERLAAITSSGQSDTLAKLAVLFGEGFRVLPPFTLGGSDDLKRAMERRAQAGDAGRDKTIPWLQMTARVREGARHLATAMTYAEVASAGSMPFRVAQFPFDQQDSWNLPLPKGSASTGATSIIAVASDSLDTTQPLAGLLVDEWVEVIPSRVTQTTLAFHYDAPGACAPQAILLAVSPDPSMPWDPFTLAAILNETLDLAQLRTVDYDALSRVGHLLPALFLANNVGGDPNGDTVSSYLG